MRRTPRRAWLAWLGAGAALAGLPGALSARAALAPTPAQTEGPFYPPERPSAAGSDLLHGAHGQRAEGEPLALGGRVLARDGAPLVGVVVEIWQCDARGVYRHPRAPRQAAADPAFRGFGRAVTDGHGAYAFTTIVPVAYPGRPPHIHVKVWRSGEAALTTQLYLAGDPRNARDWLLSRLLARDTAALQLELRPASGGTAHGKSARFDLVL